MSPRKTPGQQEPANGRPDDKPDAAAAISENATMKKVDAVGDIPIPWRTSRRLQEATYRLIQERDQGVHAINNMQTMKQKHQQGGALLTTRSLKREQSDSDLESEESIADGKESIGQSCSSRKKRKKVHFSNPLFVYIGDQKLGASSSSKSEQTVVSEASTAPRNSITPPKQPMSCFDLLCNHVGRKGWRCYRSCTEGTSFCNFHQTSEASIVRISVCT